MNTVALFGAKGILGIGPWRLDCGSNCAAAAQPGWYYVCASGACSSVTMALDRQVPNVVTRFAQDDNGSVIQLPMPASDGSASITGSLIFGIGTRTNNALGAAVVQTVDAAAGTLFSTDGGQIRTALIDSGTSIDIYPGLGLAHCVAEATFYCPDTPTTLSATNIGLNGARGSVSFVVGNVDQVARSGATINAYAGAVLGDDALFGATFVDWGLPFFMGRSVYNAIAGAVAAGTPGPWVAY